MQHTANDIGHGYGDGVTPLDQRLLDLAIGQAEEGRSEGGIPIGAVLAVGDEVLGAGRNRRVQWGSAIRHGETDALEQAGRLPATTYAEATMYTTLSPCHMCAGAILLYGIPARFKLEGPFAQKLPIGFV